MNTLKQNSSKFLASLDQWFFCLFLITFTLSVRKVLFFYPFPHNFNENTGAYLYISDIFLLFTLISWAIIILYNKINKSSSNTISSVHQIKNHIIALKSSYFTLPLGIILLSFLSIIWSENKIISLYRSTKFLEFFFLYLYILYNLRKKDTSKIFLSNAIKIIVLAAIFHSAIAIIQFLTQHSVGLFWLKESLISQEIPGVAKLIFNRNKYIRAYGLFPHPNILGGFLLFSIILTWYYNKLLKNVPRGTFWDIILALQILALFITFSKSAILGLFIAVMYIFMKNVPRGTFYVYLILLTASITITIFLLKPDLNSIFINSLKERWFYLGVSSGIIVDNLLLGVGSGQFILNIPHYISQQTIPDWQFQPVHNVFLLIWSELGLVGLGLFITFIWKLFHACPPIGRMEQFPSPSPAKGRDGEGSNCSTWNNFISSLIQRLKIYGLNFLYVKPVHHPLPLLREEGWKKEIPLPSLRGGLGRGGKLTTTTNIDKKEESQNIIKNIVPRGTFLPYNHQKYLLNTLFKAILLSFIFIMLFDHYLWDIHQGQIILWITLGLAVGTSQKTEKEPVR